MTAVATGTPLVEVSDLSVHFALRGEGPFARPRRLVRAVDGVSLQIRPGCTLGLVGESGSGKSTLGRAILALIRPTAGEIRFDGRSLQTLARDELRALRRQMQIVFQDPYGSLDPRMTIERIVAEPLHAHGLATSADARERVAALLRRVGLQAEDMTRYPHEFSGGQRQRIGIARALASSPRFVVCDEAVSALDVSVQSQILNLLADLRAELDLTLLFISHNLAVVRQLCDEVAVMYLGRIVERGPLDAVFESPQHPYTQVLLAAVPEVGSAGTFGGANPPRGRFASLPGEPASPITPPPGCAFHPRCRLTEARCMIALPVLDYRPGCRPGHAVACHVVEGPAGPAMETVADRVRRGQNDR